MGIYDEVPDKKHGGILDAHRQSASVIEASDLEYTILRPAWFTNADEIDYETTQKGEPLNGSVMSRKSVAALIVKLAESPELKVHRSLGVSKPEYQAVVNHSVRRRPRLALEGASPMQMRRRGTRPIP